MPKSLDWPSSKYEFFNYSEPNGGWEWVTGECRLSNWAGVEPNDDNGEEYGHMNIFGTWSDWNGESYAVLPFAMK